MKLSEFKFDLPEEQIALYPAHNRDESRMLVLNRKTGEIEHKIFKDLVNYFDDKDVFVFNDTRVFPARLYGNKEKTGAKIEVFLLRELNKEMKFWDVLVDPARKIRIGNKLYFGEDDSLVAEVIDNTTSRGRTLRFLFDGTYEEFRKTLYELGETPLPRFINRPVEPDDEIRYQTIFAKKIGAVAAPAAGLHFSKNLLKRLEIRGVETYTLTSHMGLGNFKGIEVEDLSKHKVESEQISISAELVSAVDKAHEDGKRICAVGTEVMRALEHVVGTNGQIKTYDGWTNKFIYPPYNFTVANAFFVNFYMPMSTQLIMVAAFGGQELVMKAYKEAVKEGYRFGDYGDAMLVLND